LILSCFRKYGSGKKTRTALEVKGTGDNQWKSAVVTVSDMELNHSGAQGSDFILVNSDGIDDAFNGIETDIVR